MNVRVLNVETQKKSVHGLLIENGILKACCQGHCERSFTVKKTNLLKTGSIFNHILPNKWTFQREAANQEDAWILLSDFVFAPLFKLAFKTFTCLPNGFAEEKSSVRKQKTNSDTFTVQKKKRLQSLNTAFNLFLPLITQSVQEELDLISKWHYKRLFSHFLFKFAHKGHCFVAWPTLFTKIDSKKMALPKIEKKMTQYGFSVQSKSDHYCRRTEGSLNTVSNKHI